MYEIPSEFIEFIRLGCNRLHFIQKYLQNTEIPNYVIQLDDKNHIVVNLCSDSSSNKSKKLLIAHYDRVNGTPGANDNSSAVFCLLTWAIEQAKKKLSNNITIIFTDGEGNPPYKTLQNARSGTILWILDSRLSFEKNRHWIEKLPASSVTYLPF